MAVFFMICFLLMGCGNTPRPEQVTQTETQGSETSEEWITVQPGDEGNFEIVETMLPLSEDALSQEDVIKDNNWMTRETERYFWGEKLYCFSYLFEEEEGKNFFKGACIQVLAPPYDQWENQVVIWQKDENNNLRADALAGGAKDGVLLKMRSMTDDMSYLAHLAGDGSLEILLEMPIELERVLWHREDELIWALSDDGKTLTVFDKTGQQQSSQNLTGKVMGVLENPQSGETMRLYLNRNAGNREGAIDFLRYLVSEEGQRQYMEYGYKSWELLPVRRSLLQEVLDRYQQNVTDPPAQSRDSHGISYAHDKLDEELQPYFNNARSAEDAAAAFHSRVQIYLDEQK